MILGPVRLVLVILAFLGLTVACAGDRLDRRAVAPGPYDSPIPGTIGIAAANQNGAVVVVGVRAGSAAARADVRIGDRIRRCNGEALANARGFRKTFSADPTVGGRFSALTHFGLVPAALMGIDLDRLLDYRASKKDREHAAQMLKIMGAGVKTKGDDE